MPKRSIRGTVALLTLVAAAAPLALSVPAASAGPPEVDLPVVSIGDVTIRDGITATRTMRFNVSLSKPRPGDEEPVQVSVKTIDGTAGTSDYGARLDVLTIPLDKVSATIEIQIAGDTIDEATEFFGVKLFNPKHADMGRSLATGTLIDELPDTKREISIGEASIVQTDEGKAFIHLSVTMSRPAVKPVTVAFATANGTAVAGQNGAGDFQAKDGHFTIESGQTSKSIRIALRPKPDGINRFFTVNIGEASRYRIGDSSGTAFITSG
jgi:hypothetical protein